MKRLFTRHRVCRLLVSLLLCMGLLLPLVFTVGAGRAAWTGVAAGTGMILMFSLLGSLRRGRLWLGMLLAVTAGIQMIRPGYGLFGDAWEGAKSIALFFNHVPGAAVLYARETVLLLAGVLSVLSYAFSGRNVGFIPAAICIVLTLYGMWSLGGGEYLWYIAPAFVALLMLVSQTSHEREDILEVLPMSVLVVVLSLLILPAGQTVIGPLYDKAMDLKQTIEDYLFFTEPRNIFSLGNYGYYPMGNSLLGGPVEPSSTPVMTVKTEDKVLLRAVTKDEYTGRQWRDTASGKRYLYVNPRWSRIRENVFTENLPSQAILSSSTLMDEKAVSVQMQDTEASTVPVPDYLRSFKAQGSLVAYFNDSGELFATRDLQRGDAYTAFAPDVEAGSTELGNLIRMARSADASFEQIKRQYTKLPQHLESKVYEDLNAIVSGAQEPYDKACAILNHLKRNYRYTLTPAVPPDNQDFVTYFLYVGKEGYCTYFASAMTVLCRMAGLPARYAEGFMAVPGEDGFAYVTGRSAHAWTEVYFEGFGWVPFDPTPDHEAETDSNQFPQPPEPTPTPEPEDPEPTPTPEPPDDDPENEPEETPEPPENEPPDNRESEKHSGLWWLLLIPVLLGLLALLAHLRSPDYAASKADNTEGRLFVYGSAVYQLLLLCGLTVRPGETPMAYADRLDRTGKLPVKLLPLWKRMALSLYAGEIPEEQDVKQARAVFTGLDRALGLWVRLRLRVKAVFAPFTQLDTPLRPALKPKEKRNRKPQKNRKRKSGVKK